MNAVAPPVPADPVRRDPVAEALLQISDLQVQFHSGSETVTALRGVTLKVGVRETVAVVGESGSGKSTAALSVLGLLPQRRSRVSGTITFAGRSLATTRAADLRKIRGGEVAMVFQDPMTALNPTLRVGHQIAMALRAHTNLSRHAIRQRVLELLTKVGLTDVANLAAAYPHSLSGGMSQRVVIALALSCNPRLLIADEPTTALDVTIQAQILQLLHQLQADLGLSILLITHDLGVVAELATRVYVMYAGRIVESGSVEAVLTSPEHPYTQALLDAIPRLDRPRGTRIARPDEHSSTPAAVGCSYRPRCPVGTAACDVEPALRTLPDSRAVACWNRPVAPDGARQSEVPGD